MLLIVFSSILSGCGDSRCQTVDGFMVTVDWGQDVFIEGTYEKVREYAGDDVFIYPRKTQKCNY